ncbi:MAG: hypothetical protein AUJ03_00530 [Deltaproteobacteria bacterium 13_1_40CM_3_71_4]|nr:MAG: hypothetical protein AUJ03_00530 [Deltaproteobacteria bacterium 13_1_40CM_3_71_4]
MPSSSTGGSSATRPGGEIAAANALARKLTAEGIAAEVIESAPGRGSLYARLPGRGGARPVILLSHLDVVPADARSWRVPPFAGAREGGFVYGRGALDCKGIGAVDLMAMIAIKRSGEPLDRDLILLATADEETGGKAGAGWLVQHRPDVVGNAEYCINEGDHIHQLPSGRKVVQLGIGEKTPCWVKLAPSPVSSERSTRSAATGRRCGWCARWRPTSRRSLGSRRSRSRAGSRISAPRSTTRSSSRSSRATRGRTR